MSYLLEALRKSERERQENRAVPGLQTPTVEWEGRDEGRGRSPWLVVAVVAICLNTVLLALLVWRFGFAEPETAAVSPAMPASTASVPANPVTQTALPPVIVVQQPREPAPAVIVRERTPDELRTPALNRSTVSERVNAPAPITATGAVAASNTVRERAAASTPADEATNHFSASETPPPNVNALPVDIRQQLPLLTMNSHIYANNARDSFVMINGVSLNPGDEVSAGVRLIAVVPEGAVLAFNGQRFLLPALASFSP
ncbi:MAG TPA: general secretion pathway protein GspB [Permianibacter sp.]|nr:general secretion pathway protein GspB [Permianibacter sp.]